MPATCFDTPIGSCAIAWRADEITGFSLPPARVSQDRPPPWVEAIIARVKRHLAGEMQDFSDVPYAWSGVPPFQRAVYQAALRVKAGQTWSYGQLAAVIGQPVAAARAVGTALGQNPGRSCSMSPFHRRGRAHDGISAPGGIKTKLRLLALEGAELFPNDAATPARCHRRARNLAASDPVWLA